MGRAIVLVAGLALAGCNTQPQRVVLEVVNHGAAPIDTVVFWAGLDTLGTVSGIGAATHQALEVETSPPHGDGSYQIRIDTVESRFGYYTGGLFADSIRVRAYDDSIRVELHDAFGDGGLWSTHNPVRWVCC